MVASFRAHDRISRDHGPTAFYNSANTCSRPIYHPTTRGALRHAAGVLALLVVQPSMAVSLAGAGPPEAIPGGFELRRCSARMDAASVRCRSNAAGPAQLAELAAVALAVFTGGLIGVWFIVRTANLAGFAAGSLARPGGSIGLSFLCRSGLLPVSPDIAAHLLAEPLLRRQWSASRLVPAQPLDTVLA